MTDDEMAVTRAPQFLEKSWQVVWIVQFHFQLKACGDRCRGVSRANKVAAMDVFKDSVQVQQWRETIDNTANVLLNDQTVLFNEAL